MPRKNRKQYKSAKFINSTGLTKNVEFLEVPLKNPFQNPMQNYCYSDIYKISYPNIKRYKSLQKLVYVQKKH